YGGNNLYVVEEIIRKQRADGAVDETRSERLLLGGPAFMLEEAAGNSACRVCLFDIVDSQGEEIAPWPGRTLANSSDEDGGIPHGNFYGPVGLPGHPAGLY